MNLSLEEPDSRQQGRFWKRRLDFFYTAPYWLFVLVAAGLVVIVLITTDAVFERIFDQLKEGIVMTLGVSFIAYSVALIIGLIVGLIRSTPPAPPKSGSSPLAVALTALRVALYNLVTLYVQVLRGLPILVTLLIVAFVLVPAIKDFLRAIGISEFLLTTTGFDLNTWRGSSPESAVVALAFTYGAFLSETFRAGIQSVDKGQREAARSLGMNFYQVTRYVVLPQAIRRILPPLGNDLVAMIKDSSLVAILGVRDITQIAKTSSGRSFRYMETYLVVAVLYLTMAVIGSILVRFMERRLKQHER